VLERSTEGDFLLKWEVSPDQEGNISIFSAKTDHSLEGFSPIASTPITDQVIRLNPSESGTREFFILRTSNAFSGIVANRFINTERIKNFRDAGGYFTTDNRQMRWGMIFRSGDLSSASLHDQQEISQLGIRTIIDFRSERNARQHPILLHPSIQIMPLPLVPMDLDRLNEQLENDALTRSDAIRHMQEIYVEIVSNHKAEFAEMFNILTIESNYPVLITDALGKDAVGLAIFFILYAIGIPENVLVNDYMLSNRVLSEIVAYAVGDGQNMSESMQQAVTAMLSVNRAYLNFAIEHIRQTYGSINNYIENELQVTSTQRSLLRRYLLYQF
jgi:protein-tyrosine phosphatase